MRKKLIEALFLCSALYFLSGCAQLGNTLYDPVVSRTEIDTPWSGLAANALIAGLAIFAHVRSRKWRAATISAVSAAQEFKEQLTRLDLNIASEAKAKIKIEQKLAGTQPMVQDALRFLGR